MSRLGPHAALADFWVADRDATLTAASEVVVVDGPVAVARLQLDDEWPEPQQHRDLWLLRFAEDGRVSTFGEWAVPSSSRPPPP